MTWREYHEATKHSTESLRRNQHDLEWANMPDPFRHYEGVPVLDLPAEPPALPIPALELLRCASGATPASDGAMFLSQLLFNSAAISATKRVPQTGYEYALRVNPSSGNLHPTEFHFATRGLKHWPDGLYHYRPSSHMAEQRALGMSPGNWTAHLSCSCLRALSGVKRGSTGIGPIDTASMTLAMPGRLWLSRPKLWMRNRRKRSFRGRRGCAVVRHIER